MTDTQIMTGAEWVFLIVWWINAQATAIVVFGGSKRGLLRGCVHGFVCALAWPVVLHLDTMKRIPAWLK